MTEQQIIELAHEADEYANDRAELGDKDWIVFRDKRFAALVAAHAKAEEREKLAAMVDACDPRATPKGIAPAIRALKD